MARIPDNEVERLKSEVSVERLVQDSGIELKKSGKDWLGSCPFHADDSPSLVVTPAKNLWHCFGCGIGGGPIDWVMKRQAVSFRHAVELLKEGVSSLAAVGGQQAAKRSTVRGLAAPIGLDADEQTLLNDTIAYYHARLKQSPEAQAYLESRGLADADLIDTHKLGLADRTLGLRLPEKNRAAGAEVRARLQRIGLLRESGHEHFNGSLVIPVFDEGGNVTEVYGRKLLDNLRVGTPKHLYLPGPHQGIWNAAALKASKEIILCEALIDALSFWRWGHRNVTSAYGVEGLTEELVQAFKSHGITRVLIAFDRDEAGDRGAEKVAERLMAEGIACSRIRFPKGMDANAYTLKVTPADKSLGLLIKNAEPMGDQTEVVQEASPLAAKDVPAQDADPSIEVSEDEVSMCMADRRYRVRGLAKNLSYETMKVNVLASKGEAYYVDTFDLYAARPRQHYVLSAAKELAVREDVIKIDLGRLLLKLEQVQEARIKQTLQAEPVAPKMSEAEHKDALDLLRSPDLLQRIVSDFELAGLVGESTNKLMAYLAAVSRKLPGPLALVVQSSSAAGKSSLMDAVLAFIPEEERVKYSAMTGQSLFYMGETNLKHKILAICEEEGASRATYALKVLQSDGELTIASTGKDPATGNLVTQQYRVEGPVMIFLTTTAIEIDEELLNRCIVLSVDEGREQTEAIHRLQRAKRTLAGLAAKEMKGHTVRLHQNAQRLLRPLAVVNPYADQLTFLSDKTRTRRDHEKYLTLIDTIALLHQHQRPVKAMHHAGKSIEYIEATIEDIAAANKLAHEVLGRSLDELPPVTRRLLTQIARMVADRSHAEQLPQSEIRFSRREVRETSGLSDTQLRVHLDRLVQLEYLLTHRGSRGQSFEYELLYDGKENGETHLSGLIDVTTISSSRGQGGGFAPPSRGQNGANAAPSRVAQSGQSPNEIEVAAPSIPQTALPIAHSLAASYPRPLAAEARSLA